jgi:hypothetical protein
MTRDEIENMPAGREMDVLMIDVMSGELIDLAIHFDASMGIRYAIQDDGVWKFEPGLAWLWSPSTDITAAWQVVEKLKAIKPILNYEPHPNKWYMRFNGGEFYSADTAPLAICRAALIAVGD